MRAVHFANTFSLFSFRFVEMSGSHEGRTSFRQTSGLSGTNSRRLHKIFYCKSFFLLAAVAACISTSAEASSIAETVYGTVTGGIDPAAFGVAYQNGKGNFGNQKCCYASFDDTAGDSAESLSVNLNGQTFAVTSSIEGFFEVANASGSPQADILDVFTSDLSSNKIVVDFAGASNFAEFNGSVPNVINETPGFFTAVDSVTTLTVNGESFTVSGLSTTAPEPSTTALVSFGGVALIFLTRRNKRRRQAMPHEVRRLF
jgi:hypothetical protein